MKHVVFILFLVFWGAFTSLAQTDISGVVVNSKGIVLAGANLKLAETFMGTTTDMNGTFRIRNIPNGKYSLIVSYLGYKTDTLDLNLAKKTKILDIHLESTDILADEIIVKAVRASGNMPVAHSELAKKDIEKRNLGQDIPYLLNQSPSFVATSDAGSGVGYTSFRIRGTDMSRINITVNGIPLNDPESHGTWFVDLPDFATSVDNVQIQRGVGTSTNGAGAFGATVNFQTFSQKKEPFAELNISYGSFNTRKENIVLGTGLLDNKFSFEARLSDIHSDGYIDRAKSNLGSASMSGTYSGKKDMIKMIFITGKEKTYQAWDGVPGEILDTNRTYNGMGRYTDLNGDLQYYDNETDNYKQSHFQLFYSRQINPDLFINTAFHYTLGKGYYEQYKEDDDFRSYGLPPAVIENDTLFQSDLIRQKWLDNDFYGLTYSLDYRKNRFNFILGGAWNTYLGNHFGKIIWAHIMPQADHDFEWYRNTGDKSDFTVYGKLNFEIKTGLSLYADLQYRGIHYKMKGPDDDLRDISQTHDFYFFNPKIGLLYNLNEYQNLYFSWAVANREPNRYNFKDADPDKPSPVNETLHDFEAGYSWHSRSVRVNINLYYMNYFNQLALTGEINDVGAPVMSNVDKSFRRGVEMEFKYAPGSKFLWDMNATFSQSKIQNFTEYVDDWDTGSQRIKFLGTTNLSFSPQAIISNSLNYYLNDRSKIGLISKFVGKQYIDNTSSNDRMLKRYFVNNLAGEYIVKKSLPGKISLRILINNIFNTLYESNAWVYSYYFEGEEHKLTGYYPQAGINYLVGLNVKF